MIIMMNKNIEHKRATPEEIKRWLRSPNKDCIGSDIFEDPGYSGYYKSMTSIYDDMGIFYEGADDIDNRLKYPYHKSIYKCDEIDKLEEFVDNIPSKASDQYIAEITKNLIGDDKKYTTNRLKYDPILIPPGTNHSNANVLYKIIQTEFNAIKPFIVPILPDNPNVEYDGDYAEFVPSLDKKIIYRFCYENSIHKRNKIKLKKI